MTPQFENLLPDKYRMLVEVIDMLPGASREPKGSGVRVLRGTGTGCLFCTPVPLCHDPWYPWVCT